MDVFVDKVPPVCVEELRELCVPTALIIRDLLTNHAGGLDLFLKTADPAYNRTVRMVNAKRVKSIPGDDNILRRIAIDPKILQKPSEAPVDITSSPCVHTLEKLQNAADRNFCCLSYTLKKLIGEPELLLERSVENDVGKIKKGIFRNISPGIRDHTVKYSIRNIDGHVYKALLDIFNKNSLPDRPFIFVGET